MDESKPPIPPSEFHLPSASERTSADIDPAPAALTNSGEHSAVALQLHSEQVEPRRNDPSDGASVTVYYRNEEEIREGFFIALGAMGVAAIEPLPEPPKHPVREAKP